jgi:hypothetical protein
MKTGIISVLLCSGGVQMAIKSITGYCEQCGSKGPIHLVINGEDDYDWCCGKCLENNTYTGKTMIPPTRFELVSPDPKSSPIQTV